MIQNPVTDETHDSSISGAYNAIFENAALTECSGPDYILRSTKFGVRNAPQNYEKFKREVLYGVIAAENGFGPNIYEFGIMSNDEKPSTVNFFSIMDNIKGGSVCDLMEEPKNLSKLFPIENKQVDNIFDFQSQSTDDATREIYVETMRHILEDAITQSKKAGECGMLLMDAKPLNSMIVPNETDPNKPSVVLVDFDPKLTSYFDPAVTNCDRTMIEKMKLIFSYVNVLLYLMNGLVFYDAEEYPDVNRILGELFEREYLQNEHKPMIDEFVSKLITRKENIFSDCVVINASEFVNMWNGYKYGKIISYEQSHDDADYSDNSHSSH